MTQIRQLLAKSRQFVLRYKMASAAGGVILAVFVGWRAYQGLVGQPTPPPPPVPSHRPVPAPGGPGQVAPGQVPLPHPAGSPPGVPGGASSAAPAAPDTTASDAMKSAGRTDPFQPLVSTGGGGARLPSLPPVPSLSPDGTASSLPPLGPAGALRLVGILGNGEALAIVADERASYIVGPGDEIGPEVQVVRIDLGSERVEVRQHGVPEELTLQRARGGGVQ